MIREDSPESLRLPFEGEEQSRAVLEPRETYKGGKYEDRLQVFEVNRAGDHPQLCEQKKSCSSVCEVMPLPVAKIPGPFDWPTCQC